MPSEVGVPQGSIISPLLSNLILNKLDDFVESLKKKYNEESQYQKHYLTNPEHIAISVKIQNLTNRIRRWKVKGICSKSLKLEKALRLKERNRIKSTIPNAEYTRIEYVRYADD